MPSLLTSDGVVIEIPAAGCILGRGTAEPGEGVTVVDLHPAAGGRTVSRRHAALSQREGVWYLDLQPEASNPAWVDDLPLEPQQTRRLNDGARIRLGDVFLTFVAPAARQPRPSLALGLEDAVAALTPTSLTRVTPFFGMMIDDATWRDAHEYHRQSAALDRRAAHGWGIAQGLHVHTDPATPGGLLVQPGIALDALGRLVIVPTVHAISSGALPEGTHYVTLRWIEHPEQPQPAWQGAEDYSRSRESYTLTVEAAHPAPPAIELARIIGPGFMRNAQDLRSPGVAELDQRYRAGLQVRAPRDIVIGSLQPGPRVMGAPAPNALGLQQLSRAISGTAPYRARLAGAFALGEALPQLALLYLADSMPFTVAEADLAPLRDFLAGGGVLLADRCSPQQNPAFTQSVRNLATQLGRNPTPVLRGHPLLDSRHLFTASPLTPEGEPALEEHEGFVTSTIDLGLCWQGGSTAAPLEREAIRGYLELGVNLAAYGRQRCHPFEVLEP